MGAATLKDLRATPAQKILDAALATKDYRFWPDVDGYYFPESPWTIYSKGEQSPVTLMAGWNENEQPYQGLLGPGEPTAATYESKLKARFGEAQAQEILKYYGAKDPAEIKLAAGALVSDRWIAYSTWQWLEFQVQSGRSAVYRYHFEEAPPVPAGEPSRGVYHSADIEYVFGTLDWKKLPWTDADRKVSELLQTYWTNFAKTGDPNGVGAAKWPVYSAVEQYQVMHLSPTPHAAADEFRPRYLYLAGVARSDREGKSASGTR
jgi:para-nitrobenzyl esterase